jgi:diguanylate cyclase (GGDEF)-like protein
MHAFPLTNGSDFQGLLLLVDIEETAPGLSRVAYQAMEILGTVLAAVLSRLAVQRELESLAFSDPLTGLPNRRVFQHQLRQEIDRSKRLQTPFCLVLLDLDKFKAVNDTFGHRIGDLVLKAFAEILRSVLRKSDTGARIGGDEFAILAIGTTQSEAENLVQRIRAEADRSPVTIDEDHRLTIAFSFGIQYGNSEDTEVLFEEADQALYRAKNSLYL